jgi:MtN3 and saliva related transmembrane protein
MDINYIALIGLIAGICTTLSFLPQVIKTITTKQTKDISMAMYIILAAGLFTWIIYGILIEALPVIMANVFSLACAVTILILKIKHG